jgi:precorrin-6B methylase 2
MHGITHIGGYEILESIHEGRATALYRARTPGLARDVALKTSSPLLRPDQREGALRGLAREVEVLAALEHPAFTPVYAIGEWARGPFLVTPWLAGGTLLERFRTGASLAAVAAVVARIGEGLDALHQLGWIHGDLSARNIMFDRSGAARMIDLASSVAIGSRFGTDARWAVTAITAAPELSLGEPIDGRADLYSLGVIAFFLLTGSWPFVAERSEDLRRMHAQHGVPSPSSRCALLGPAIDDVLLRALAKRPDERFQSGAELARTLTAALLPDHRPSTAPALFPIAEHRKPMPSDNAVKRAYEQLEAFAEQLPPEQRAAFTALVGAIEREDADSTAACGLQVRSLIAPVAAMTAAEQLGIYRTLAETPKTIEELALACGAPVDTLARLCEFLRALGQLAELEGRWQLRAPFAGAYGHGQRLGVEVRLVHDTLSMWAQLPQWIRSGEPAIAMDNDATGHAYADAVAYLGDSCDAAAAELARLLGGSDLVPEHAAILDVGAGSAVWSLAMCAAWPQAHTTALDRPRVLDVALARASAAGLSDRITAWIGDWREVSLPVDRYDLIVLANVCHLQTHEELGDVFTRLSPALTARGRIVIIDVAPERLSSADVGALRYDLALALRTDRGRIHDRVGYESALAVAGLRVLQTWPLARGSGTLDVLLAGR